MNDKIKRITLGDTDYQIKRFVPDVGSFILGRILNHGALALISTMKAVKDLGEMPQAPADTKQSTDQASPEMQIKRMANQAFGVMSFEERSMIQRECLKACARIEAEDTAMPLANANGSLVTDLPLVLRLELETLVFNFYDFFAGGGVNALFQTPAPRT